VYPLKLQADFLMRSTALHIGSNHTLRDIHHFLRPRKNAEAAFAEDFSMAVSDVIF
jgi:hypothetical protein